LAGEVQPLRVENYKEGITIEKGSLSSDEARGLEEKNVKVSAEEIQNMAEVINGQELGRQTEWQWNRNKKGGI